MAYDGRAVANFILDVCEQQRREVSNLALQKIVYFCHVWSLIELKGPLVKHKFEAWEYGPVLPYLYREFKSYDRSPIQGRAMRLDPATGENHIVEYDFDQHTVELLRKTVEFYSRLRPGDLVELSHAKGGPWHKVWHHSGTINPGMQIDNTEIAEFYSRVVAPFLMQ